MRITDAEEDSALGRSSYGRKRIRREKPVWQKEVDEALAELLPKYERLEREEG